MTNDANGTALALNPQANGALEHRSDLPAERRSSMPSAPTSATPAES